jgi:hypothetical protein
LRALLAALLAALLTTLLATLLAALALLLRVLLTRFLLLLRALIAVLVLTHLHFLSRWISPLEMNTFWSFCVPQILRACADFGLLMHGIHGL